MKKELYRIVGAFLVLCGLTIVVWKHRKGEEATKSKKEEEEKLIKLDLGISERMAVTTANGKVVFEKRPKDEKGKYTDLFAPLSLELDSISEWMMVSPVKAPVDTYSIKSILDNLKDLKSEKTISDTEENAVEYNLEKPPLQIDFFDKGSNTPKLAVKVGDENSAKSGLYVQVSNIGPKIFLTTSTSLDSIKNRSVFDWRAKEVIGFKDVKKVKKVSFEYNRKGKKEKLLVLKEGNEWKIREPKKLPGDDSAVEGFLGDLKSLRATEFVSEDVKKDSAKFGLSKPFAKFLIVFDSDLGEQERKIFFAEPVKKEKDKKNLYLMREDLPYIFAISETNKEKLFKELKQLVMKKPLHVSQESITQLWLSKAEEELEVVKKDGKWMFTKPKSESVNEFRISSLLWKLIDFKADEYVGDKQPPKWGKQKLAIRIQAADKTKEAQFFETEKADTLGAKVVGEPPLFFLFKRTDYEDFIKAVDGLIETLKPSPTPTPSVTETATPSP